MPLVKALSMPMASENTILIMMIKPVTKIFENPPTVSIRVDYDKSPKPG
jgi:hypothetical protein